MKIILFGMTFDLAIVIVALIFTLLLASAFFLWIKYGLQFRWIGSNMRECRQCGAIQNFVYEDDNCSGKWHEQGILWEDGSEEKVDRDCSCHKYETKEWS